jgi:hypothetical protein
VYVAPGHREQYEWRRDPEAKAAFESLLQNPDDGPRGIELSVEFDAGLSVPNPPLMTRHDAGQPSVRARLDESVAELSVDGDGTDLPGELHRERQAAALRHNPASTERVGLLIETCGKIETAHPGSLP